MFGVFDIKLSEAMDIYAMEQMDALAIGHNIRIEGCDGVQIVITVGKRIGRDWQTQISALGLPRIIKNGAREVVGVHVVGLIDETE
jgi:hypothetical protein